MKKEEENILKLIEKNKIIIKNTIQKLEKNVIKKNPIEMNWNLNDITIDFPDRKKTKEKERKINDNIEKEKDFSFGDNMKEKTKDKENKNYSYNNKNQNYCTKNHKNDIIKVKKLKTIDKRININISYLCYEPPFENREQNKKDIKDKNKSYMICSEFIANFCGKKNMHINCDKKGNEKVKFFTELASIKEEDNKIEQSGNVSKGSII